MAETSKSSNKSDSPVKTLKKNEYIELAYAALFSIWFLSYKAIPKSLIEPSNKLYTTLGIDYQVNEYSAFIPFTVNLVITSTLIVYIGSHRSIMLLASEAEGGSTNNEILQSSDAYAFPIVASCSLLGLYFAFKTYPQYANILLSVYFSFVGIYTLTRTYSPALESIIGASKKIKIPNPFASLHMNSAEIFCFILASCIVIVYSIKDFIAFVRLVFPDNTIPEYIKNYGCTEQCTEYFTKFFSFVDNIDTITKPYQKHLLINNLLGISFCVQSIEQISIGSYQVGATLLVLLFFYDIFWVFGTEVMVTVAKNLDGPIKLLFLKSFKNPNDENSKTESSLLGLGDIVIPGLFVALLLRYDAMHSKTGIEASTMNKISIKNSAEAIFSKPFFTLNLIFYALGLITTVFVMFYFKAAQPALLYLVPACLIASLIVAFQKQEFNLLYSYDETPNKDKNGTSEKTVGEQIRELKDLVISLKNDVDELKLKLGSGVSTSSSGAGNSPVRTK